MKGGILYCLCISLVFIAACSSPKELFTTKEIEENNRFSEIDQHFLKDNLVHFLDYRAYKDSFINAAQRDSTANIGLIADRLTFTMYNNENEMYFGNDRDKCIIHYTSFSKYQKTEPAMIDLFSKKKSNGPERQTETRLIEARAKGTIQYPAFEKGITFYFDNHTGYLLINRDSFVLKPIYRGKSGPFQTVIGVQLVKENIVYGVVHSFTGLLKKKIFLYTKATADEQLLTAAYFAVIARYL